MGTLNAATILKAVDLRMHNEVVPEWPDENGEPGTVRLRQLTAYDSARMSQVTSDPAYKDLGMYVVTIFSAVDEENKRIFPIPDGPVTENDFKEALGQHIVALQQKSMPVLIRLQTHALRLNSLNPEKRQEIKNDSGGTAPSVSPTA